MFVRKSICHDFGAKSRQMGFLVNYSTPGRGPGANLGGRLQRPGALAAAFAGAFAGVPTGMIHRHDPPA